MLMAKRLGTTELTEHRRQKVPWLKETVEIASMGDQKNLAKSMESLGDKIIERKSNLGRHNQFIKAYLELSDEERKKTLLVSDLNQDRRELITSLRKELQSAGKIGSKELELQILKPKDLTEIQKHHSEFYTKGDVVIPHDKHEKLVPGLHYQVEGLKENKLELSDTQGNRHSISPNQIGWQVYEKDTIKVAEGDVLEWRKNHNGYVNRDSVTVKKADSNELVLSDKDGKEIKIDPTKSQHLDYGLIRTVYSTQGATCDRVIALTTANASKESWYVILSRAQYDVKIITDDKANLLSKIARSSKQKNALDFMEPTKNFEKWIESHGKKEVFARQEVKFVGKDKGLGKSLEM